MFNSFMAKPTPNPIPPNLRSVVRLARSRSAVNSLHPSCLLRSPLVPSCICVFRAQGYTTGVKFGGSGEWQFMLQRYTESDKISVSDAAL